MTRRPNAQDRFRQFAAGITDPGTGMLATRRPNPARCRHLAPLTYRRDFIMWQDDRPWFKWELTESRCMHCDVLLPLGPSNDAPPEVQQEIRAAEIAANLSDGGPYRPLAVDESRGWWVVEPPRTGHDNAWHAGYLARAIVEHDDS